MAARNQLPPPPRTNTGPQVESAARSAYNPGLYDVPFSPSVTGKVPGGRFSGTEYLFLAGAGLLFVWGHALRSGAPWPLDGGGHEHEHAHFDGTMHTHHHREGGHHS